MIQAENNVRTKIPPPIFLPLIHNVFPTWHPYIYERAESANFYGFLNPPVYLLSTVSVQVKLPNWNLQSKIYLIFTSYKLLADGQSCRGDVRYKKNERRNKHFDIYCKFSSFPEGAEYECPMDENFKEKNGKLCMSIRWGISWTSGCNDHLDIASPQNMG